MSEPQHIGVRDAMYRCGCGRNRNARIDELRELLRWLRRKCDTADSLLLHLGTNLDDAILSDVESCRLEIEIDDQCRSV